MVVDTSSSNVAAIVVIITILWYIWMDGQMQTVCCLRMKEDQIDGQKSEDGD